MLSCTVASFTRALATLDNLMTATYQIMLSDIAACHVNLTMGDSKKSLGVHVVIDIAISVYNSIYLWPYLALSRHTRTVCKSSSWSLFIMVPDYYTSQNSLIQVSSE